MLSGKWRVKLSNTHLNGCWTFSPERIFHARNMNFWLNVVDVDASNGRWTIRLLDSRALTSSRVLECMSGKCLK